MENLILLRKKALGRPDHQLPPLHPCACWKSHRQRPREQGLHASQAVVYFQKMYFWKGTWGLNWMGATKSLIQLRNHLFKGLKKEHLVVRLMLSGRSDVISGDRAAVIQGRCMRRLGQEAWLGQIGAVWCRPKLRQSPDDSHCPKIGITTFTLQDCC